MPVDWNAPVMFETPTETPGCCECRYVNAGSQTELNVASVNDESRTTRWDAANSVHTTGPLTALIDHWRRERASSDPKKSVFEGVENEEAVEETSEGSIDPKTATSSIGMDASELKSRVEFAGGTAGDERINFTKAIATLTSGIEDK